MNEISIIGAKFYAYHGYYPYEQITGNEFEVDVIINSQVVDIEGDQLEHTIDYEKIYRLLENQMEHTASLMETVIYRFMKDCKEKFPQISNITMSMKKLSPIPGAQINHTKIKISQAF